MLKFLTKMVLNHQRSFAIVALLLTFNVFAQAATEDRVAFSVNCRGVLDDILKQGYSPLVVGFAQNKDGDELSAEEFETFQGDKLYVPKSALNGKKPKDMEFAKGRYREIANAHEARMEAIGKKKYEKASKKCEASLTPPVPTFKTFKVEPDSLNIKVGETAKFSAVAILSNGAERLVSFKFDDKMLTVTPEKDRTTFVVKGLKPGNHLVSVFYEDHEWQVKIHVEDYGFFEKLFSWISNNSLSLVLLLALLLVCFVLVMLGRKANTPPPAPTANGPQPTVDPSKTGTRPTDSSSFKMFGDLHPHEDS